MITVSISVNSEDVSREERQWNDSLREESMVKLCARIAKLEEALEALLEDTQHSSHQCSDEDCPVEKAKQVLNKE